MNSIRRRLRGEVITGPPGSGKSTHVGERRGKGDFLWDYDDVQQTVFGLDMHTNPPDTPIVLMSMLNAALDVVDRLHESRGIWIIIADLRRAQQIARQLRLRLTVMSTNESECAARIVDRPEAARQRQVIRDWFKQYGAARAKQAPST